MKGLFVTINSIEELTGGGLYARTLYCKYKSRYKSFDVICKSNYSKKSASIEFLNGHVTCVKKSIFSDLVSRVFLSPTFLMYYFFLIFQKSKNYDVVHFHSSRSIFLAILVKIFLRKKVFVHFDNVEYKLSLRLAKLSPILLLRFYDSILLFFYERWLGKAFIDDVSFITNFDKQSLSYLCSEIIPIKVFSSFDSFPESLIFDRSFRPLSFIFVASFSHSPNVKSFIDLLEVASVYPSHKFVVAGKDADSIKFDRQQFANVIVYSDVTDEMLDRLYKQAHVSLNLVSEGGGMKTKIAESMSYCLPVICYPHSAIGYESVIGNDLVQIVNNTVDIANVIEYFTRIYSVPDINSFEVYWSEFESNYMIK